MYKKYPAAQSNNFTVITGCHNIRFEIFSSSTTPDGTSTTGLYAKDFFGDPMFNITVPGNSSGRNAGIIRRKIPVLPNTGGDMSTRIAVSQICDPIYDNPPTYPCQVRPADANFSGTDKIGTPQGVEYWKRVAMPWNYWNPAGQMSLALPNTISVSALPPPDPAICHFYSYETPGCWFTWFWGTHDCYAWCSGRCYSNGEYCDPLTYSF